MHDKRNARRFIDKTVIVTGAAQGIGRGVALRIAAEGAQVLAVDRSEIVREVVADIVAAGGSARAFLADLETFAGARAMAAECLAHYGRIDVLVNNVGGTIWTRPYEAYDAAQIEAEIRRSLFPALWGCRAVLPAMLARKRGTIVNVSSIATRSIYRVPYAAAKGGVNALTASLAMEHAAHGIRINATAPGGTDAPARRIPRNTGIGSLQPHEPARDYEQPDEPARGYEPAHEQEARWYQGIVDQTTASSLMHRYGTLDEQVAPILFLASDESSYITGTVLPVGGGDLG